jgi:hypothetical protein
MKKLFIFLMSLACNFVSYSQNSIDMDARVLKHYTPEQIKEIELKDPSKLKALNFYYSSSFIVHSGTTGGTVDPATVDVTEFEHLRKEDKRAITGLNRNGATIELLSWNELKLKYQELSASKN